MGYYTRYTLTVPDEHKSVIKELRSLYPGAGISINRDGKPYDATKWYDHEEDLIEFSRSHPEVLFCLEGKGEEPGDFWKKYFLSGRRQVCKAELVYPPYDPNKLE